MNAKRIWISLIVIVVLFLTSHVVSAPAEGSPQEIYVWTFFRKAEWYYDPFYGERVLVYEVGDVARIDVLAYNPSYLTEFNIIEVSIRFDWMPRDELVYSEECSREDPYVLKPGEFAVFSMKVEIPDEPGINELPHLYDVNIVALEDMEEQVVGRDMGTNVAVYSREQAEAVALYERLSRRLGLSPLSLLAPYVRPPTFTTSEAIVLAQRASVLAMDGLDKYKEGDFAAATDDFLAALELFDEALDVEAERGRAVEEALIQQADAALIEANAAKTQAEAAKAQADAAKAQADIAKTQAEAAKTRAEAAKAQADAAKTQADAQMEQAQTVRELASAFEVLAWGLTVGTILVGIGVVIYAVRGLGLKKRPIHPAISAAPPSQEPP